jgi:gamma-glutamylcyclotransferase (GGCT)/AIG2-like uncharacterized protein YtfP
MLGRNDKVLVFVYGSLLSNLGNHHRLVGSTFIGEDSIRAKLFTCNWSWPFIIFSNSNKDRVVGEVYEVTYQDVCNSLDHLEGYHRNHCSTHDKNCRCLFLRKKATTRLGRRVWVYEGGHELKTLSMSYTGNVVDFHKNHIKSGNWRTALNGRFSTELPEECKEDCDDCPIT